MGIGLFEFVLVLLELIWVNGNLGLHKQRRLSKLTVRVGSKFSANPEEGFFEVVVTLRRDIVILQVLLAVELNILRAYLTILAINFVTAEANRDAFTHAGLDRNQKKINSKLTLLR